MSVPRVLRAQPNKAELQENEVRKGGGRVSKAERKQAGERVRKSVCVTGVLG